MPYQWRRRCAVRWSPARRIAFPMIWLTDFELDVSPGRVAFAGNHHPRAGPVSDVGSYPEESGASRRRSCRSVGGVVVVRALLGARANGSLRRRSAARSDFGAGR